MKRARRQTNLLPGRRRRGMILIICIWLIVMLSFIAYGLSYDMRIGIRMTSESKKSLQALGLARKGMAKAVMDLRNDRFMALYSIAHQNDTLDDIWAHTEDKTHIETKDGAGSWTVRVADVNRKLDVNLLTQSNYEALAYLLSHVCGLDDDQAENISLCVVDYIDADSTPSIMKGAKINDDGKGGGESEAYTAWAQASFGSKLSPDWKFHPRNDAMLNIDELLEIPGITKEILYGEPSEGSRDPIDRMDSTKPSTALADFVCAGRRTGVNVNTAPEEVLAAMIAGAMHGSDNAESVAAEIVQIRKAAMKTTDKGPAGLRDFNEMQAAGIASPTISAMRNGYQLRFNASEFDIFARGEYRGYRRTIAVTAAVSLETFNVDSDKPETLGKRDTLADGIPEKAVNLKVDPAVRIIRSWEY